MNDYWKARAQKTEANAQKHASTLMKREAKLYNSVYKRISKEVQSLVAHLYETGNYGAIGRTEIWKMDKYTNLLFLIDQSLNRISSFQLENTRGMLYKIMKDTLGEIAPQNGNVAYNILNKNQAAQIINQGWSGEHYSQRIWKCNTKIAERLKQNISDMIIVGKSPTQIKNQIKRQFGVSYNVADRLVRTQASHAYNEAAKASYKQAGVEEMQILVQNDGVACQECIELGKQKYRVDNVPMLPIHPNCRCCYVPVVEF